MSTEIKIFKNSTSRVGLTSLTDIDGAPVLDAVVETTLYEVSGPEVTGAAWPLSLTHDVGGSYYATLSADLGVESGRSYILEMSATASGAKKTWRVRVECEYAS